jgi:zinc D-Ala-D-Ala dipeptidase
MRTLLKLIFIVVVFMQKAFAQPAIIINTKKAYQLSIDSNVQKGMINVKQLIPSIVLDLRYNSINNFTKIKLYISANTTYMRKPAANALLQVQKILKQRGLGIKIFDAYRPYTATKLMWELIKDERYVANPKNGSNHNRGLAVDLTLINLTTKQEINMGTGFDNFTDTAHHTFNELPEVVLENRKLLKTIMEQFGFKAFDTEWWHYSWPNDANYEVMDINFMEMKKWNK